MRPDPSTRTTAASRASSTSVTATWSSARRICSAFRAQVQSDEDAFGVREVADDLAHRFGQPALEGRDGDDLLPAGQLWALEQVDDLNRVLAGEVLLADPPQVRQRRHRAGRLTGHVQAQLPRLDAALVDHLVADVVADVA